MSENILSPDPTPARGDSSTGDLAESQVGTPKAGGVSPVVLPQSKKSPILLFIAITLLAVVSVFAIYLFLQVRTLTLEKTAPSPTPTPVASADPTADWETYLNTTYNFSFKHPKSFDSLTENEDFANGNFKGVVIVQNFPRAKTPNYSDEATFQMLVYVKEDIGDTKNQESLTPYGNHGAYINKVENGYVYQIDFTLNKTENINLPDQILSTFKFTEQ